MLFIDAVIVTGSSTGGYIQPEIPSEEITTELTVETPSDQQVVLDVTASESSIETTIEMYPNPSFGLMNIKVENSTDENVQAILHDHLGRKIDMFTIPFDQSLTQKDFSHLDSGLYMMTYLLSDNSKITKKIFIVK